MELTVLLPIVAFIALAAGLVVVLRGTGRIVARARELEGFRATVKDLAGEDRCLARRRVGQIDAVRRRQIGPDTITDTIAAATDAVERYAEEAKALRGPGDAADPSRSRRRPRACAPCPRHGRARGDDPGAARRGPRELEAQTAIKRGYLNLIHAREAIARHALAAQELEVGEGAQKAGSLERLSPDETTPCSGILRHTTTPCGASRIRRAMRCPQCGERETRVVDSRDLDDSATIRRRRECAACAMRFTTYERVEAARLVVIKRDGSARNSIATGSSPGCARR